MNILALLALCAGACIALQAAMNAQLGQIFQSSLLATSYAFATSCILVSIVYMFENHNIKTISLTLVPWYLWLSCIFSVIGVASFYYLIPKMGVGNMMTFALTGQIILAMLISHFGWFSSPIKLISLSKLIPCVYPCPQYLRVS